MITRQNAYLIVSFVDFYSNFFKYANTRRTLFADERTVRQTISAEPGRICKPVIIINNIFMYVYEIDIIYA